MMIILPTIFRKGISFSLGVNAIAEIRNTLLNLNWMLVSESETEVLLRSFKGCEVNLVLDTSSFLVRVQDGESGNLSPILSVGFEELALNQLWLTANEEAIALTVKNGSDNSYIGLWAGYLQESNYFGLGYIGDDLQTYIFKDNEWLVLSTGFTYSNYSVGSFPSLTYDRLAVATTPIRYYDFEDDRNSAFEAYKGAVNGATNEPLLDFYPIIEGKGSAIGYGLSDGEGNAPKLGYLGLVQFACVGMQSLAGGTVVTIPSGVQYLCCGDDYQGMRIS